MRWRASLLVLCLALVVGVIGVRTFRPRVTSTPPSGDAARGERPARAERPEWHSAGARAAVDLVPATVEHGSVAAGSFGGIVVSRATGQGVPAAEVRMVSSGAIAASLRTDARGEFTWTPAREGAYGVEVEAAGFFASPPKGGAAVTVVARAGRRVSGLRFVLDPIVTLKGIVRSGGKPIQGAFTRVSDEDDEGVASGARDDAGADAVRTDADGAFGFVARRGASVEAWAAGYRRARARVTERVLDERRLVIDLVPSGARASARIAGRVIDEQGRPLDAVVRAVADDAAAPICRPRRRC